MGVKVREKPKDSGVWWVFINHHGQRKSKRVGDYNNAVESAKKIQAKLTLNEFDIKTDEKKVMPTFKEYSTCWLEDYVKALRRFTTYQRYKEVLTKYVYPTLAGKPIDEIKRAEIRNLILKQRKAGSSKSTICIIRDVISGTMNYAVDEELIPGNPVTGILKRLQLERDKQIQIEPLNEQEVHLVLETTLKHFREQYEFFLCAFRTGMRLGEILALKWGDIDFNQKFIRVERSFKRGRIEKTKTGKIRRVDMSDQLVFAFRQLLNERKKEALKQGLGEPVEFIFHRNEKPIAQNSIRNIWKRILKKAGIREMRLHDIRHTFASLLLSMGESPVYVKEQLGHSSIKITVDVYGHLIPSSNRGAVNQLDSTAPIRTLSAPNQNTKAVTC